MDKYLQHTEAAKLLFTYTDIEQTWEEAGKELHKHILHLLENNLQGLYQLLYKIDIDEKKAKEAFGSDPNVIATNLTELILQRILQKAESRLKNKHL